MAIHGITWVYMAIHGYTWWYVAIHGNTWQYMVLHGYAWLYVAIHGDTWRYMVIHGNTWHYMGIRGYTWCYMAIHGNTWQYMALHGYTRVYMVIHGNTWHYMGIHCYTWLCKNNYARAIKLDVTFFSFGFYIFEVFSSLLNSRRRLRDVQKETIWSERVDNHLCLRVLRHAQQQDKLNAKKLIHGICSIFRLFLYKLILNLYLQSLAESISCPAFTNISTMHRRKKRQTSAKRHDDIVTPQLPRYNKLDSSSSENTSAEIRPISCVLGVSSDDADDVAQRTIVSKE